MRCLKKEDRCNKLLLRVKPLCTFKRWISEAAFLLQYTDGLKKFLPLLVCDYIVHNLIICFNLCAALRDNLCTFNAC